MNKREIIMDHYSNPRNQRKIIDKAYLKANTNNANCIDNLDIYILLNDNIIKDIAFFGEACAISISSASIMTSNLKGCSVDEALNYIKNMESMLNDLDYDPKILKEAVIYEDTKNTSRKTCCWLPYKGAKDILEKIK